MKKVNDILDAKGHKVWTIRPDASVYDAIQLMAEKKVGALMVMDGNKLVGVISETDYTRKITLKGRSSPQTLIKAIMSSPVVTVEPWQDIEQCMVIMTDERNRHLPVIDNGKLIGVISIGDVVKSIIDEQRFTIEQMENYITG